MPVTCAQAPRRKQSGPAEYGLKVGAFRPGRRWAVDNVGPGGYAHRLSPEERAWLEQFNREYYDADNRTLRSRGALHNTDSLRRSCYAMQNASHRDVYARGMVEFGTDAAQDALGQGAHDGSGPSRQRDDSRRSSSKYRMGRYGAIHMDQLRCLR